MSEVLTYRGLSVSIAVSEYFIQLFIILLLGEVALLQESLKALRFQITALLTAIVFIAFTYRYSLSM